MKKAYQVFLLRMISSIVILLSLLFSACTNNKQSGKDSQLAGMYKLHIAENLDSNGVWQEDPWTKDGKGYIVYDGFGHMAVQITPRGYKDYEWMTEKESIISDRVKEKIDSMSVDELKEAVKEFSSSYVYIANYNIEDTSDIVQHHRISSSIPAVWGTTVRRAFSFSGDTLILRILNGNRRLKWIRQN